MQVKKYEPVSAGQREKSMEHRSSIPGRKSPDFSDDFLFFPAGNGRKSPKISSPEYCFHVPLASGTFPAYFRSVPVKSAYFRRPDSSIWEDKS